jgi:hypothetical protein
MYTGKAAGAGAVGTTTLAYTGMNTLFYVVASFTLVMAGLALMRLRPKSES